MPLLPCLLLWNLRKISHLHCPLPRCKNGSTEKLFRLIISKVLCNTLILSFFPSRGFGFKEHIMGTKTQFLCCFMVMQRHLLISQTLSKIQSRPGRCQCQGQCQGIAVPAQLWSLPSSFKFNLGEWEVGIHFYFWSASC